jgi:Ni/Co efflux regulator RcnB
MTTTPLRYALLAALMCLALSAPAAAKPGGHGPGADQNAFGMNDDHEPRQMHREENRHEVQKTMRFSDGDRSAVRGYWSEKYPSSCPPGLAKKHNRCQPPGQAKKRYTIGHQLPPSVVFETAPPDLIARLSPPPMGYHYVTVDNDVLLLAEATHKVVDAITLMSAMGK